MPTMQESWLQLRWQDRLDSACRTGDNTLRPIAVGLDRCAGP